MLSGNIFCNTILRVVHSQNTGMALSDVHCRVDRSCGDRGVMNALHGVVPRNRAPISLSGGVDAAVRIVAALRALQSL